jgi:hypothetical protein
MTLRHTLLGSLLATIGLLPVGLQAQSYYEVYRSPTVVYEPAPPVETRVERYWDNDRGMWVERSVVEESPSTHWVPERRVIQPDGSVYIGAGIGNTTAEGAATQVRSVTPVLACGFLFPSVSMVIGGSQPTRDIDRCWFTDVQQRRYEHDVTSRRSRAARCSDDQPRGDGRGGRGGRSRHRRCTASAARRRRTSAASRIRLGGWVLALEWPSARLGERLLGSCASGIPLCSGALGPGRPALAFRTRGLVAVGARHADLKARSRARPQAEDPRTGSPRAATSPIASNVVEALCAASAGEPAAIAPSGSARRPRIATRFNA